MGITVSTLALASVRKRTIPDHLSGKMVRVRVLNYKYGHPVYVLVYDDGVIRGVKWLNGQAVPGEVLDVCLL